jgi:hypothetical protein
MSFVFLQAVNVIAALTESAAHAGRVMVDEDAVPGRKLCDGLPGLHDFGHDLVARHQRRLAGHIPFQHFSGAQPARADANQQFPSREGRKRDVF